MNSISQLVKGTNMSHHPQTLLGLLWSKLQRGIHLALGDQFIRRQGKRRKQ